jgi:hypothetical protein
LVVFHSLSINIQSIFIKDTQMAFQPYRRISEYADTQSRNGANLGREYADKGPSTSGVSTFKYPLIEKPDNMMAVYFNEVESIFENNLHQNPNFSIYASGSLSAIGNKNKAYGTITQEEIGAELKINAGGVVAGTAQAGNAVVTAGTAGIVSYDKNTGEKYGKAFAAQFKKHMRTESLVWILPPTSIRYGDGVSWQNVDFDPGAIGQLMGSTTDANKDTTTAVKEIMLRNVTTAAVSALGDQANALGESALKTKQNTWNDMAFEGVQRRQFQFQWQLFPKSKDEFTEIDQIIRQFRFNAMPSYDKSTGALGAYLSYPGQIDIEWYTKDHSKNEYIENAWLPKISTCVVTAIDTDFTPNSQFAFHHDSGAPAEINFSITCTEVQPLLKYDIARGF